jgi:hypothetical protein
VETNDTPHTTHESSIVKRVTTSNRMSESDKSACGSLLGARLNPLVALRIPGP